MRGPELVSSGETSSHQGYRTLTNMLRELTILFQSRVRNEEATASKRGRPNPQLGLTMKRWKMNPSEATSWFQNPKPCRYPCAQRKSERTCCYACAVHSHQWQNTESDSSHLTLKYKMSVTSQQQGLSVPRDNHDGHLLGASHEEGVWHGPPS
jgi:hypothetical protein